MSIKLENDDEQDQRSRLKELITRRLESQSIALATEQENERDLRSRLKKGILYHFDQFGRPVTCDQGIRNFGFGHLSGDL